MAQLAIAALGSAIGGSLITGTVLGLSGATIGYLGGSLLASALIKGPNSEGPRLGDLRVNGSEYGAPIPWLAGGPRIAGQIAWASDLREIANTQKVGKGGGSKVTNFVYEVDLLILLTENELEGIGRIWLNGEMIYNGTVKEGVWNAITFYSGSPSQLPDPTYEAAVGAGNAPAYRGRGYVVIQGLQLGTSGQIPNLTFERGIPQPPSCNFQDFSLNEHPVAVGVPTNFLGCVPGVVGSAGSFSGNNTSGLRLGTTKEVASLGPGDVTMAMWLYYDRDAYDFNYVIFSNRDGTGINPGQYFDMFFDTGKIRMTSRQLGNNDWTVEGLTASSIPIREWFHFAFTSKQEDVRRFRMFINGVLDVEWVKPNDTDPVPPPFLANTEIGMLGNADFGTLGWPGLIDEFFIESTALWTSSFTPPTTRHTVTTATQIYIPFSAVDTFTTATDTLEETTAALLTRAGYAADEFDVSALAPITQPVRGIALGQVAPTRGALEALQTGFLYEPAKSDKIYIRPRATTPVADIPFTELGASTDSANSDEPLPLTIGNELEIPAQVSLSYHNMLADYNIATEHSDRLITGQLTNQVTQLGLGLLPSEAKGVADALLIDQIASLTRTTLRLPLKYAFIEPGDVFTVTNQDGRQYRLRSITKRDTLTIIDHECVVDDAGALTSSRITSNEYALTETVRQIAPTVWETMDIPLLRDADNQAGFYVALAPSRAAPADEWNGAAYVRSWAADAFVQLFNSADAATMGGCTSTLGDFTGGSGRFDESNALNVVVIGELASTTRADMLDDLGLNAALVGSEIIRFRLAEFIGLVVGRNEYRLSGLLRGQRGTEQHIGTHASGERFVLLNTSLRRVLNQISEIGVPSQVKAVTLNTLLSAVGAVEFTDTGVALKPFSVANLRALANGTDLVLTWNRRTRLSYRYGGIIGASVPLGEASEAYRIDVYAGAALVRTGTATDGTFTYTAAQIAADGFASTNPVTFVVRQVSEIVGPGFPATVESTAP